MKKGKRETKLARVCRVLLDAGPRAYDIGDGGVIATADDWMEAGLDLEQIKAWLAARCWCAGDAADLADLGVTPEQASKSITEGGRHYTVAEALACGQLTLEQAVASAKGAS
jgi:hypothetical protein